MSRPAWMGPANPEDWIEDSDHENGNYQNNCSHCRRTFSGHKRRYICKLCCTPPPSRTKLIRNLSIILFIHFIVIIALILTYNPS